MILPVTPILHERLNYYINYTLGEDIISILHESLNYTTITPTQVYKQISPIVRKNTTNLFIYRLRNYNDLESIVEELSAIYDMPLYRYIMRQLAKSIVSVM